MICQALRFQSSLDWRALLVSVVPPLATSRCQLCRGFVLLRLLFLQEPRSLQVLGDAYFLCYLLLFLLLRVFVQIRSLFLLNYDSAKFPVVFI